MEAEMGSLECSDIWELMKMLKDRKVVCTVKHPKTTSIFRPFLVVPRVVTLGRFHCSKWVQ